MSKKGRGRKFIVSVLNVLVIALLAGLFLSPPVQAFTLHVIDGQTNTPMTDTAFRWMVEVDNTFNTVPGAEVTDQLSFAIHNSYAPVAMLTDGSPAKGDGSAGTASVNVGTAGRYYVTVMPNSGYAIGGAQVPVGATDVYVYVEPYPLPTAQITVFVFKDHWPINNAPDLVDNEPGLGGATLIISDAAGPLWQDAFGNPLGTMYDEACVATAFDPETCATTIGDGVLTTLTVEDYCGSLGLEVNTDPLVAGYCVDIADPVPNPNLNPYNLMPGEAIVKYIPPGKYGIVVNPPNDGKEYILTSTIEGTPTVDAWVLANEAPFFVEQFGAASPWHAFFGFVTPAELPWVATPPVPGEGETFGSLSGENRFNHFARPPNNQAFAIGPPVDNCWVGVNDAVTGQGLYAASCEEDSTFTISGIPEGQYELVTWDLPLDALFSFHAFQMPETIDVNGEPVDPPNYNIDNGAGEPRVFLSSRWFGTLKGNIFVDGNENGFPDDDMGGLIDQAVNLRFRDGTIYQATVSDPAGDYELTEVFPFFKWLIAEVDFLRYKATGMTAAADMGGPIPLADGWVSPSFDALTPQPQTTDGSFDGPPIDNPNTGNNLSRTEEGEVLTQAIQLYLTQTNVIDWGKNFYGPGPDGVAGTLDDENGGISGIVYYAVTRAEDDPRYAAAETWEPGIPNVQMNLYHDDVAPFGTIDCLDEFGDPLPVSEQLTCTPELADIDNPPFSNFPGAEDIDHNSNGTFDYGDAVQITYTDSFDDNKPTGCIQDLPVVHGNAVTPCFDGYGTWNQVRDGVFDGGYAFGDHYERGMRVGVPGGDAPIPLQSGTYIVEAGTPHGYIQVREEDKNVDFGDEFIPSTQALPPVCVGEPRTVPPYLSLWTDDAGAILPDVSFSVADLSAPFSGDVRPLCDRKQVSLRSGLNAAAEFFFFTKVPKAARGVGFINNDLAPEFNMASPAFGEKMAPSWLPVSLRDWNGREVARTYSDEFGSYEFLVPGSYTVNQASPTGVTLAMYNIILNDPLKPNPANPTGARIPDEWHATEYSVPPWVFQFETGRTSYIDSPIVPTAAFVGYPSTPLDVNPPSGIPVIFSVNQSGGVGAVVCAPGDQIVITSQGTVDGRDNGFGSIPGTVFLSGIRLPVAPGDWTNTSITATVPAGVPSGTLTVTRGDNDNTSVLGTEVLVGGCTNDLFVDANNGVDDPAGGTSEAPFKTIQYAIDSDQASAGTRIFVTEGTYNEQVILYKEVSLIGSGVGTVINSRPAVQSLIQVWRDKLTALGGTPDAAIEVPGIMITFPELIYPLGRTHEAEIVIEGFKITGGTVGGGIYVLDNGANAEIRNNLITGNQGQLGGGITVGIPGAANVNNTGIHIHKNQVFTNSGVNGGGGVVLYEASHNYLVENNVILGNFSRGNGAGISHVGNSDGGRIQANVIALNENFYFAPGPNGDGGGIYIGNIGDGTGSVVIDANLIKSNLTGSGFGGGIRIEGLNSADTDVDYTAEIYNNIIVNNVAAMAGAGISLQDAAFVSIVNNTIAHNDSTSTALLAFPNTNLNASVPMPAGIQANVHSAGLAAALGTNVPNPVLVNNIVFQNRSFYHEGLNVGSNALVDTGYWDLGITGQAVPGTSALNPVSSVLSSLTGAFGEDYNDGGSNIISDPAFNLGYFNTLQSAATLDEGGNNISVRFDELDLTFGNYHLTGTSPAIDVGAAVVAPELAMDYDGDVRPQGGAPDIGADEIPVPTPIGVFRSGPWFLDANGNGAWDPDTDTMYANFGQAGDLPVVGDWPDDAVNQVQIGVFRNGTWYLDANGNGAWDPDTDTVYANFGQAGDLPVVGDWNGDGVLQIGVFRNGIWYLDANGNGAWDSGIDTVYANFGQAGDLPVVGDWNGDGVSSEVGVFRNGTWYLDANGSGIWGPGSDTVLINFGQAGDYPVTGNWLND
ncbi:MAG: hypothetical protein IH613_13585 [Desulfuromonadales bacterium]|nr:hypothetical protein [Desulfuromonadales bacterium]